MEFLKIKKGREIKGQKCIYCGGDLLLKDKLPKEYHRIWKILEEAGREASNKISRYKKGELEGEFYSYGFIGYCKECKLVLFSHVERKV